MVTLENLVATGFSALLLGSAAPRSLRQDATRAIAEDRL
jgi:hypothetical protein